MPRFMLHLGWCVCEAAAIYIQYEYILYIYGGGTGKMRNEQLALMFFFFFFTAWLRLYCTLQALVLHTPEQVKLFHFLL